jgi:hypothetical protein
MMTVSKDNALAAALFIITLLGTVLLSLSVFSPKAYDQALDFTGEYAREPIRQALSPKAVNTLRDEIDALGSRMLGHEGLTRTADFIAGQYRDHGLELFRLDGQVAAPVTERNHIERANGHSMPDVELYPFPPNALQPVATPAEGLTGRLLLLDENTLLTRADFQDSIGVIRLDQIPRIQGLEWTRYAQIGLKGLILVQPEGIEAMPWDNLLAESGLQSILPVNFLRAAASPLLLDHLGEEVRIDLQVRFRPIEHQTLVGILRAESPKREALVIPVPYDHYSILPEYGASPYQSFPLATHLALVKGLSAYAGNLERDVIFVATGAQYVGFAGLDHLLRMLGPLKGREATAQRIEADLANQEQALAQVQRIAAMVAQPEFLVEMEGTLAAEAGLSTPDRRFFEKELRYVLNTRVFDMSETLLSRRIAYERGDTFDLERQEYCDFLETQYIYEDLATAASLSLQRLLTRDAIGWDPPLPFTEAHGIKAHLQTRIETLKRFHRQQHHTAGQGLKLNRIFAAYEDVYVFSPAFLPRAADASTSPERVSFVLAGPGEPYERVMNILANDLSSMTQTLIQQTDLRDRVSLQSPAGQTAAGIYRNNANFPVPTSNWTAMGYRAFTLVNTDRVSSYRALNEPSALTRPDAGTMADSLAFAGEFTLALAKGFGRIAEPPQIQPRQFSGSVVVSDVGRSLVPNYPLAGALLAPKPDAGILAVSPARFTGMLHFTDPYGAYTFPDTSSLFVFGNEYNLQSVYYDDAGLISHIKDESASTQNLFRSILPNFQRDFRSINLVAFRASPVTILDTVNPQTLRPFSSIRLLQSESLTAFDQTNSVTTPDGVTTFIPPDATFFVTFRAGTPDNELVQIVRSYMGGRAPETPDRGVEINGQGYLAMDQSILQNTPLEQAESMLRLNSKRLELQEEKGLADRHTIAFSEQSKRLLEEATDPEQSPGFFDRMLTAGESLTYSIIIHPLLRKNISDAVISILWYMGLLIPFMFFFEKLVFGFSDIRKQLAAHTCIFLVVFLLLRLLHPAFEMIRSSVMILLGFFILLISAAITLLFAGKFRENLEEIKQRQGKVTGAEVNSMGVIGTAFMLGLNNMHRRKIRTGLTCLTLVLITFAMICFTSITSDFEDVEIAVAPATYQGLVVKNEKFAPISGTERFAIDSRYGYTYPVAPRSMVLGTVSSSNMPLSPELEAVRQNEEGRSSSQSFSSILRLAHNEPLRDEIPLLTDPYWFAPPEQRIGETGVPVLIPESMAQRLGISLDDVNAGGVPIRINGGDFMVRGVFDESGFLAVKDLDGRPLLPFDVRGLREIEKIPGTTVNVLGDEDGVLIAPGELIIAPTGPLGISISNGEDRLVSLALNFGQLSLREAREEIVRFLEQRARPAFYGVSGTSYRGSRMRVSSFAGLIDLIIPLLIAALTVLNTMKGSVYERRDEIYVYNAVGIAPKFIFFMFFAEAFVYAVVGCVLGYLLSQGTGTLLTALDLTGGMNMTFASVNSIYASLAVVAAVFISTYFPAKSAMEIAAPAEDAGWSMPPPEGDVYRFNLPFTFDRRERVAVLEYFHRFIADHGEGGSGAFSAAAPAFDVKGVPEDVTTVIPSVSATIWLKPYDLGVSQEMCIETPIDEETGDFVASIQLTRSSGTRESWERVNRPFIVGIRKQFLHWRAVSPEMKTSLYQEACSKLRTPLTRGVSPHGS